MAAPNSQSALRRWLKDATDYPRTPLSRRLPMVISLMTVLYVVARLNYWRYWRELAVVCVLLVVSEWAHAQLKLWGIRRSEQRK